MNTELQDWILRDHRQALADNADAYTLDFPRVIETVVPHLKTCGYTRVTRARCARLIDGFVDAIFETQDRRPFFHIEADLPYCWNSPQDFGKNYIRYQWGHLRSRSQNGDACHIQNLCLQSARCNQHIQTSMDIDEVLAWLEGSRIADRIRSVLGRRERLFASQKWRNLLTEFDRFR